jgi:subtilisin
MATVIITLASERFAPMQSLQGETFAPGVILPVHTLGTVPGHWKLPRALQGARLFPALGFAVVDVPSDEVESSINNFASMQGISAAQLSHDFEIIKPVDDYVNVDAQGDLAWHFAMTGIDKMHDQGLTGKDILVGVLDSGVDPEHTPQLAGRLQHLASFDTSGGESPETMKDPYQHGTFVCGLIAGDKIGVAPGASLAVARIAPDGATTFEQMLGGLNWLCATFPALRVINSSIGKLENPSSALEELMKRLKSMNKLLICAIGNEGPGTTRTPGNLREGLAVGAVDLDKGVASFSGGAEMTGSPPSYTKPDLVMPGVKVPSCVPGGVIKAASGTSFASPMLAGLAALFLEKDPSLDVGALQAKLIGCCQDLMLPATREGHGLPYGG